MNLTRILWFLASLGVAIAWIALWQSIAKSDYKDADNDKRYAEVGREEGGGRDYAKRGQEENADTEANFKDI